MKALMQTTVCIDVSENVDGKQEKIFLSLILSSHAIHWRVHEANKTSRTGKYRKWSNKRPASTKRPVSE